MNGPIAAILVRRAIRQPVAGIVDARDREAAPCEIPEREQRVRGIFRVAVASQNRLLAALWPQNDCGDLHAVRPDVHVPFGRFAISAPAKIGVEHERIDAPHPRQQRDDCDAGQNPPG